MFVDDQEKHLYRPTNLEKRQDFAFCYNKQPTTMASQVAASHEKENAGNRDGGPMFPSKKELLNSSSYSKDSEISNGSSDGANYHQSIAQAVTLSDGEDSYEKEENVSQEFQSPSPLSKLYQSGMTPLPLLQHQDQNGSYWAMMERYVGTDISTEDGTDGDGNNTSALTPGSLTALMDMSLLSEKSATRTPSKLDTTTPKRYYDEWRGKGTPSSNDKSRGSISSKGNEAEDSIIRDMLDNSSSSKLSPSPIAPSEASPFSTFKTNSSHIALDETKVYLRRIQELQKALQSATEKAEMESKRREAAEDECRELKSQIHKLSPLKTPPSKQSDGRPRTPMSDSLWERNKTLVKEVRFADQTCVELSSQKGALEKEVKHLREELTGYQNKNDALQKELSEHVKSLGSAEAQRDSAKERILSLEGDLASTKESLSVLEKDHSALQSKWSDAEPYIQTPSKRADKLLRIMEENDKALDHIKELSTRLDESESELDRARLEHDAIVGSLHERLQQTQEENISLRQEVQQVREQKDSTIESLNLIVRQAQDEIKTLEQEHSRELASQESERSYLQKELSALKLQLNHEETDLKALRQKIEHEREGMKLERDAIASQTLSLKEDIRAKNEEVARFEIELQYTESKLEKCQRELENLTASNTRARESQLQVENELKRFKAQHQEAQNEIAIIRVDLSEERRVNAMMKQSMTKLVNSDIVSAQQVAARKLQEDCALLKLEIEKQQTDHNSAMEKMSLSLEKIKVERDSVASSNEQLRRGLADEQVRSRKMQLEIDALSKGMKNSKEELPSAEPDGLSPMPQNSHTTPIKRQILLDGDKNEVGVEKQDLGETFDSLAHSEITQPMGQSKTALLGTDFLSPSIDPQRHTMSSPLQDANITRDLELMEEAREREVPTSPSMSTIDGVSNLLNCTIMSIAETPIKVSSSPVSSGDINDDLTEAIRSLETERDEALVLLEEMKAKLKEKEDEEDNDKLDREILLNKVKAHEEEIAHLLSALNDFEFKLESAHDKAQKLEQERDLISTEKLAAENTCESLETEVRKLRNESENKFMTLTMALTRILEVNQTDGSDEAIVKHVTALKAEVNDLKSSNAVIDANMNSVAEQNGRLQKEFEETTIRTKDQVANLKSELESLRKTRDILSSQVASANDKYDKGLADFAAYRTETGSVVDSLTIEAKRVKELESRLSRKDEENETQRLLLAESMQSAEQWKAERDILKTKLDQLVKVNEQLQKCESSLTEDLCELKKEMEAKSKVVAELELDSVRRAVLENENKNLCHSVEKAEADLSQNRKLYLEASEKLEQGTEEIKSLKNLVKKSEDELQILTASLAEEREKRIRLEDEKTTMLLEFQGFQEDLGEFERLRASLLSEEDYLVSSLAIRQQSKIEITKLEEELERTNQNMKAVTSAFEVEIDDLQLTVLAASKDKEQLKETLEESKKTVQTQSLELEHMSSKRLRLKEYTKKLVAKCEEWEVYFEKQQRLVDSLRRSSELWQHKAQELEQLFDTEEQVCYN